jgi:NitT/TauT family transport system substrate-binding protein
MGDWRSRVLLALLVAFASAGWAAPAAAGDLTQLTLRLAVKPFAFDAPLFLAIDRGSFKEGDVEILPEDGNGSNNAINLTGAGRFDLGEASVSTMAAARDKGVPVKAIVCFIRGTELGVIVPRGLGLKTPKDLEGHKVAYTAGSLEGPFMESFLRAGGADPARIELLNVDDAAKVAVFVAGRVDAAVFSVPAHTNLQAIKPFDTIMFADYGLTLPSLGYVVSDGTLRTKKQALQVFVTVMSHTWREVLEQGQVDAAIDALMKYRPGLDRDGLKAQMEAYRPYFYTANTAGKPYGWQSPKDWAAAIGSMQRAGMVSASAKAEDFYTDEFFRE